MGITSHLSLMSIFCATNFFAFLSLRSSLSKTQMQTGLQVLSCSFPEILHAECPVPGPVDTKGGHLAELDVGEAQGSKVRVVPFRHPIKSRLRVRLGHSDMGSVAPLEVSQLVGEHNAWDLAQPPPELVPAGVQHSLRVFDPN